MGGMKGLQMTAGGYSSRDSTGLGIHLEGLLYKCVISSLMNGSKMGKRPKCILWRGLSGRTGEAQRSKNIGLGRSSHEEEWGSTKHPILGIF